MCSPVEARRGWSVEALAASRPSVSSMDDQRVVCAAESSMTEFSQEVYR